MDARRERVAGWVDLYGARLFAFARTLTAPHEDARDLVQEAWMIALDHPGELPAEDEVARRWLFSIVARLARGRGRSERRRREMLHRFRGDLPLAEEWSAPDLDRSALTRAVLDALDELPELQRRVLFARLVEGRSIQETADELGRAPGTVKGSLNRAVKALRERLGGGLGEALRRAPLRDRDPPSTRAGPFGPAPPSDSPTRNETPNGASR